MYYGERPGEQPVRFKIEALAIQYERVNGFEQRSAGAGLFYAVRAFSHGEVFVRADHFWEDLNDKGTIYGTFGSSYSPSAALGRDYRDIRLTAAYLVRRNAEENVGHLFNLQGQLIF